MKDKINIILTSQDYFDAVGFDTLELKEKVAYVLYYVTEIAKLRKDMIPKIIAHRINDQIRLYHDRHPLDQGEKIVLTTDEQVLKIMSENPSYFAMSSVGDYRDRPDGEVAYFLTKSKSGELSQEFNKEIKDILKRYKKKSFFEKSWTVLFASCLLFLGIYLYLSFEYSNEINVKKMSLPEYLNAVDFKDCSDGEKGVFFTYYVTQLTQLREDITPYVICERISSLKYKRPSEQKMEAFLEETNLVRKSEKRDSAYVMTNKGKETVENLIKKNSQKEVITIKWIVENVSANTVFGFFSALFAFFATVFMWGFKTASVFKD